MSLSAEILENECRKCAKDHAAATIEGHYKAANRSYAKLVKLLLKLRATPDRGEEILRRLMKDPSDAVSMWAATYSLAIDDKAALATLENVAKNGGIVGFNAETVIKEWKAGRLVIR